MPQTIFPASLDQIPNAMAFLSKELEKNGHEQIQSFVELAVEEILVNVINYAYCDFSEKGNVELGYRMINFDDVPTVCVWIRDWGKPFDPFLNATKPDISLNTEERPIGGLGIHLVKNISKHHCYSGEDGTNTIELYFNEHSESTE